MQNHFPKLLLNKNICRRNIRLMNEKAKKNQVDFRPHFKTHQSAMIGKWFRDEGINRITVSSVKMANYFANAGWDDIFIAFPASLSEADNINHLAGTINLSLSIESVQSAIHLDKFLSNPVSVLIKIDTGYHRTGLDPLDISTIQGIVKTIQDSDNLHFLGFYSHSGHTYSSTKTSEIEQIHRQAVQQLNDLRSFFKKDYPRHILSIGDTPACSWVNDFGQVNEIRPGNFVFYDLMQVALGVCSFQDIAVALECPVVAKNANRNELVIHGGAVHLSKDYIRINNEIVYGGVVPITKSGWGMPMENTWVTQVSQEHGIIKTEPSIFNEIQVGETIGILPVHSCLTANLAEHYHTTTGDVISKLRS